VGHPIGDRHFAGEHERDGTREQADEDEEATRELENSGGAGLNDASGCAHQRSKRSPIAAPSMAMKPVAITYQVATKSGLSSGQCVA